MEKNSEHQRDLLLQNICSILDEARRQVARNVNSVMVRAYWQVGKHIVEFEQKGEQRAEYGQAVLQDLAKRLTVEYGCGFTVTNLKYMRKFYQLFPKSHALRDQLTWTHYRALLKVEDEKARNYYLESASTKAGARANWSGR